MKRSKEYTPNLHFDKEFLSKYEYYDKEIRFMIADELGRQHSSQNWHTGIQVLLVGGMFTVEIDKLIYLVILGLLISIIAFLTYRTSELKIKKILYFWNGYQKSQGRSYLEYPPVWSGPIKSIVFKKGTEQYCYFGDYKISTTTRYLSEGISLYAIPVFCIIGWLTTFAIVINK
ncbi:MAG: hypothetical protein J6J76_02670 [Paraprevotella sp.]|nr:hypothetical protein [Paraprevotella sp.]